MAFTDDNLKRLKEYIESGRSIQDGRMTKALLARLEAAEEVCIWAHACYPEGIKARLNKWRKAAGK